MALATCARLADGVADDEPLRAALRERSIHPRPVVWNDAAVDWRDHDLVLLRSTWDYMERRDEFLDWGRRVESHSRLWNPAATVEWNTHKSYLARFEARGVPSIPTLFLAQGSVVDLAAVLDERRWSRAFLKPAVGATARKTTRFTSDPGRLTDVQIRLEQDLMVEDMLLQPYLSRVETDGEVSVMFVDGALTHAVQKIPVPGDYRTQDDFDATDQPYELTGLERDLAWQAAGAIETPWHYARIDFLRGDDGGLLLTEVELVEPVLFFLQVPDAAVRLAEAVVRELRG